MSISLLLSMLGCGDVEGANPGECTDGADNDQDGYYDCEDNDCWGAPDCDDADADADTDADSDTDADGDTDLSPATGSEYQSAVVNYTLAWTFTIPTVGLEDCEQTYVGGGDQVSGLGDHVTFEGEWARTDSTCADALDDLIWVPASGDAFHSFMFTDQGGRTLTYWSAHSDQDLWRTDASSDDAEWSVYDEAIPVDAQGSASWELDENIPDVPGLILTHSASFDFSE